MGKSKELFQQDRERYNYFTYGDYKFWEEQINPVTGWIDNKEQKRVK